MKVMAVDTTGPSGSLALVESGEIVAELRVRSGQGHSSRLLPGIAFLLDSAGWSPREVEGFAVTRGPGSFTALRVGLSTVQGLALASGRPCLGVSALDVLAARIVGEADTLVAVINAYRGDVFAGFYDRDGKPLGPAILAAPAEVAARTPAGAAFVGDGLDAHGSGILAAVPGGRRVDRTLFLAGTLGRLAASRFAAGEGIAPDQLRPLYLREADVRRSPA